MVSGLRLARRSEIVFVTTTWLDADFKLASQMSSLVCLLLDVNSQITHLLSCVSTSAAQSIDSISSSCSFTTMALSIYPVHSSRQAAVASMAKWPQRWVVGIVWWLKLKIRIQIEINLAYTLFKPKHITRTNNISNIIYNHLLSPSHIPIPIREISQTLHEGKEIATTELKVCIPKCKHWAKVPPS